MLQKCFLWAFNKPDHLLQKTSAKPKTVFWAADSARNGASESKGLWAHSLECRPELWRLEAAPWRSGVWRSSSHWRTQQENCTCQEVHKGWVQSSTKPPPPILVTVLGFDFRKPEPPELLVHELWMVCSTCRGWILPLKPCQTPKYLTTEPSSGWACSPNWARMNPQKEKLWSFPTVLN